MLLNLSATIREPQFSDEQVERLFDKVTDHENFNPKLEKALLAEMLQYRPQLAERLPRTVVEVQ